MPADFVIIGAQKSASTFLHQCLAAHPRVYMPAREVAVFESPDYEHGGLERLDAELDAAAPGQLRGFKRPNLLGTPVAAPRLARHLPDACLIAVLRNPVERAVSAYYHYMSDGFIPLRPVEDGLRAVLDGEYAARWPRAAEIIEFGRYHQALQGYAQYLARGRVLVLLHEDVLRDPGAALGRVARFLGIAPRFPAARLTARPQAVVYHLGRLRVLRWRNPLRYRYNSARTRLEPRRWNAPGRALANLISAADRVLLARLAASRRPGLDAALGARLHALYAPDIAALQRLIGRDLVAWGAPAVHTARDPAPVARLAWPASGTARVTRLPGA